VNAGTVNVNGFVTPNLAEKIKRVKPVCDALPDILTVAMAYVNSRKRLLFGMLSEEGVSSEAEAIAETQALQCGNKHRTVLVQLKMLVGDNDRLWPITTGSN
jgi:hypothetical protein